MPSAPKRHDANGKIALAVALVIVAILIAFFAAAVHEVSVKYAARAAYYKAHPTPAPTPTAMPTDALSYAALHDNRDFWDRAADVCWHSAANDKHYVSGFDTKAVDFKIDPTNKHRIILHCVQYNSGTAEALDLGETPMLWYPDKQ